MYTNQTQVRQAFWAAHAHLPCRRTAHGTPLSQNQQPADTRVAFVEFVDYLERAGDISESLARRVTL